MLTLGARAVTGLDINERLLEAARESLPGACFVSSLTRAETFDVVFSHNSMEHFSDPLDALMTMRSAVADGGHIFIAFALPWLSPYGAHMHHITSVPWVHLLFPERAVMAVRNRYISDGATHYEEVEGGLNRMTVSRFESLVRNAQLVFFSRRYVAARKLPLVASIPAVREFFISRVVTVLKKDEALPRA